MSESESNLSYNDSYLYRYEDNAVVSNIVQIWCSLNFQEKVLVVLLFWLCVNLVLIRFAWRAYGHRLSEILTKGLFSCSNDSKLVFCLKAGFRNSIHSWHFRTYIHTDEMVV